MKWGKHSKENIIYRDVEMLSTCQPKAIKCLGKLLSNRYFNGGAFQALANHPFYFCVQLDARNRLVRS